MQYMKNPRHIMTSIQNLQVKIAISAGKKQAIIIEEDALFAFYLFLS